MGQRPPGVQPRGPSGAQVGQAPHGQEAEGLGCVETQRATPAQELPLAEQEERPTQSAAQQSPERGRGLRLGPTGQQPCQHPLQGEHQPGQGGQAKGVEEQHERGVGRARPEQMPQGQVGAVHRQTHRGAGSVRRAKEPGPLRAQAHFGDVTQPIFDAEQKAGEGPVRIGMGRGPRIGRGGKRGRHQPHHQGPAIRPVPSRRPAARPGIWVRGPGLHTGFPGTGRGPRCPGSAGSRLRLRSPGGRPRRAPAPAAGCR